jgi:hypothetical protein
MIAAALVAVTAAAVRMDWEGMGHVPSFTFQLQVGWQVIGVLQLHGEVDHTICRPRKIAVAAAGAADNAAESGHMAGDRLSGEVGRYTGHSDLCQRLVRGPAVHQGTAGGGPGHTGPQGGQGLLIDVLSFDSN